jgi:AsmA protein
MKEAAQRAISGLKLDVNLPGADQQATLKANLVYNGERVDADVAAGPIPKLLAGEKVPAKIALASNLATLRYDGKIQQQPVPGLDGTFDLDIASVGKLASWLGNPLDAKQPDPGPLKVHAVLTSDGSKLALRDATVTGKALKATAQAQFDGSQSVAQFNAKVDVQQADLNAYLPPSEKKTQATKQKAAAPQQQPAAGWSSEPFDVAALGQANGEADVRLASVRYGDLEISQGQIKTTLNNKVLKVSIDKLGLAKGTLSGQMAVDASASVPKVDYQTTVSSVEARPLLKTFADTDRLSGTIEYEMSGKGTGRSQKELVESLNGAGKFKILNGAIHGINLAAALRQAGSLGFSGSQTETTDFAELSGSYTIKDGVLSNNDMKMLAPLLRLNGSGTVPLPPQTIDYTVEANLVASLKGQGGVDSLAGLPIPIRITGPWSNPSYQVDWKTVFNEMAKNPERLKNLPANLSSAAKGFGLNLPVPGAGGGLNLPQNIPGLPKGLTPPATSAPGGPAPSQQPSTPSLPKDLKKLFKP